MLMVRAVGKGWKLYPVNCLKDVASVQEGDDIHVLYDAA